MTVNQSRQKRNGVETQFSDLPTSREKAISY